MASVTLCDLRAEIEAGEALIKAAAAGQLDTISELLGRDVDVNHADLQGCTAMKAALQNGHLEAAAMLLDHGAEVADGGMLNGLRRDLAGFGGAAGIGGRETATVTLPGIKDKDIDGSLVVDGWRGEAGHEYVAAAPGEVSLSEGDLVTIEAQHDDGWWVGTNRRTKLHGHFPGSYIEVLGTMKIAVKAAGVGQPGKSVASSTLFTHESPEAIIAAMDTAKNRLTELKVKQTLESTRPGDHPDDHHGDDGESAPLPEPGDVDLHQTQLSSHQGIAGSCGGRSEDILAGYAETSPQMPQIAVSSFIPTTPPPPYSPAPISDDASAGSFLDDRSRDNLLEQELHDLQLAMHLTQIEEPSQAVTAASTAVTAASKARTAQWRTSQAAEEQSRRRILAWLRERNAEEEPPPAAADDTKSRLDAVEHDVNAVAADADAISSMLADIKSRTDKAEAKINQTNKTRSAPQTKMETAYLADEAKKKSR